MSEDPLRLWARHAYLDEYQRRRRADLKAEGARRIDVTLRCQALDDYATVRRETLNRFGIEHGLWGVTKTLPYGRTVKLPSSRLPDTEVIKIALDHAAHAIREDAAQAAKRGLISFLAGE
ncbi:MAG: hypothetical protein J2P48_08110 [Alphaproteobacteria bacterium]|nr:hypothetical protein [Alphaproteobacteria bacterium]